MRPVFALRLDTAVGASSCAQDKFVAAFCRVDDDCPAGLRDATQGFTCGLCGSSFPKKNFRGLELNVAYAPSVLRPASTELVLLSADKEYPTLRAPAHANNMGTPRLSITPNPVDFGDTAQGHGHRAAHHHRGRAVAGRCDGLLLGGAGRGGPGGGGRVARGR